ncbi:MAG: response regulator [Ktedonobacteraceae bacterium]|nr:response regulator [Ktedonobacteraceae bacterium]
MTARILVLDDEEDILEVFRLILEPEGYEVHVAQQVFDDLADIERLAPDLIILDLVIGSQQDGHQMLLRLKQHPATASIPLILCTAMQNGTSEHEEELNKIPRLEKPFDVDELLRMIKQLLSSSPSPQQP